MPLEIKNLLLLVNNDPIHWLFLLTVCLETPNAKRETGIRENAKWREPKKSDKT